MVDDHFGLFIRHSAWSSNLRIRIRHYQGLPRTPPRGHWRDWSGNGLCTPGTSPNPPGSCFDAFGQDLAVKARKKHRKLGTRYTRRPLCSCVCFNSLWHGRAQLCRGGPRAGQLGHQEICSSKSDASRQPRWSRVKLCLGNNEGTSIKNRHAMHSAQWLPAKNCVLQQLCLPKNECLLSSKAFFEGSKSEIVDPYSF